MGFASGSDMNFSLIWKGITFTRLFKPCSLCDNYLKEEKNTSAKRPWADSLSHHDRALVYHFAPVFGSWEQLLGAAGEVGDPAASSTHVTSRGSRAPAPGFAAVCCARAVFWLSAGCPALLRALRSRLGAAGLWFTPGRMAGAPRRAAHGYSPALLSIRELPFRWPHLTEFM